MSDLSDRLWAKGFAPKPGELWQESDRQRVKRDHDRIAELEAEVERLKTAYNAALASHEATRAALNAEVERLKSELADAERWTERRTTQR